MSGNFCDWELEGTALKWEEMNGEGVTSSEEVFGPPVDYNGGTENGFLLVNWKKPEGEEDGRLDDAILATEGRAEKGEVRCWKFWYWVVVSWIHYTGSSYFLGQRFCVLCF